MRKSSYHYTGFTLLEILIALFVFSIISLILVSALHNVINLQSGTERNAERLRQLQIAFLMISRDVEQVVNRPIWNAAGKEEPAFLGSAQGFTLTHAGFANPLGIIARSTLQRTKYFTDNNVLYRDTWDALDQVSQSQAHRRVLMENVDVRFEYLNKDGRFQPDWPAEGQGTKEPLPRAVRINLSIPEWGNISQLYVVNVQPIKTIETPPTPSAK